MTARWNLLTPPPERDPADEECTNCLGDGWFTDCVEGANGRDEDVDVICHDCQGSGVQPR